MSDHDQANRQQPPADFDDRLTQSQPIVIQSAQRTGLLRRWAIRVLILVLSISLLFNAVLVLTSSDHSSFSEPREHYRSGERKAKAKIAVIELSGTIMPPFTARILRSIKKAQKDEKVKGVLISIDSPGGFVADSHQIYHRLRELNAKKPIFVSMKRMAASGGLYVAMGAGPQGRIYAEPTTWTGSIGVIIPRYDVSKLADRYGVSEDSLKTGEFKDSLSPFRELTPGEREVWGAILDESFQRFLNVIADNRQGLEYQTLRPLATGQIFTATQAKDNGLIDEIGFEDEALEALKQQLGLDSVRVVVYAYQPAIWELLIGSIQAWQPETRLQNFLKATVPQAMYLCSWGPGLANWQRHLIGN